MRAAIVLLVGLAFIGGCFAKYCMPEQNCWPSSDRLAQFKGTLKGKLVLPTDAFFVNATKGVIYNERYTTNPGMIVYANSPKDVQNSILLANEFNIRVSIVTSGHDFIGRNTAKGSLQFNMSQMQYLNVDLADNSSDTGMSATTEVGNLWGKIYAEVAGKYNKLIVGGSSETVSPAGYTMGGGHSPLSRKLGLAVDNVLEIDAVTANGDIVHLTPSGTTSVNADGVVSLTADTDLFWALRGGGGSTFAVVTRFKYKVHEPPSDGFVQFSCAMYYANETHVHAYDIYNALNDFLVSLPPEFGGYVISTAPAQANPTYNTSASPGMIMVAFEIWGGLEKAKPYLQKVMDFHPEWHIKWPGTCQPNVYKKWWDYRQNIHDRGGFGRTYLWDSLLQVDSFNDNFTRVMTEGMGTAYLNKLVPTCTGTLIGGKVTEFPADSSSVGPGLRNGLMALSCGVSWPNSLSYLDNIIISLLQKWNQELVKLGQGVYYNEPSSVLANWKVDYWGDKYPRLLAIKKKWDPNNRFTCLHCVGSDEAEKVPESIIG